MRRDIAETLRSIETLTEAIEKYTQWLDNQLNFAIFDQTVDHG